MSADNIDSLLDLSEYDSISSYHSPSLSPAASKTPYARATPTPARASVVQQNQPTFSGPSHQYELYKQQTGLVPGALAGTFAANQANNQITGYEQGYDLGYMSGLSPENDMFDFNTVPSQHGSAKSEMEMDFGSPTPESSLLFPETINPNAIGSQESPVLASQTSSVGRLWPGMHQQAALAKAQAQQRQQQQLIAQQQQRQTVQSHAHHAKRPSKSASPADPIVEQKITQLLNSMRAKPSSTDVDSTPAPLLQIPRLKKEEDDMDEDERLLASEEGKKLSSKERRQLRNKVSARAFRSRRKEYISQLESEIANKVAENGDLRAQNRALMDENKLLSDLTRMLLSSPSFSNFLEHLSQTPQALPQAPEPQRQEPARQLPKDINPYAAQRQVNQQQIGMAMIPEQNMDFSMMTMDAPAPIDSFNYQPQVFVVETPEPVNPIDTSALSGKTSNFVLPEAEDEDEKELAPVLEYQEKATVPEVPEVAPPEEADEEFENDPAFELYRSSTPVSKTERVEIKLSEETEDIFGGIEAEKAFARIELVDPTEAEEKAAAEERAVLRFERICARIDAVSSRLEKLFE